MEIFEDVRIRNDFFYKFVKVQIIKIKWINGVVQLNQLSSEIGKELSIVNYLLERDFYLKYKIVLKLVVEKEFLFIK